MTSYTDKLDYLKQNQHTWLITGVAGFIGSNLLQKLLELGQIVVGLDNFATGFQSNLDEVQQIVSAEKWQNFKFYQGDICNLDDITNATQGCEFVLHQAALGSVPFSTANPLKSNRANIDGFLTAINAAKDCGVTRFVYASSSANYGDNTKLPKVEAEIGNPLSPYAVTKQANELYAHAFANCYNLDTIGLRYFNVFGPYQDPNGAYSAVIPAWFGALLQQKPVYINGDGETSRDFCFIDNVVQINILAALTDNPEALNQIYNVAVGERTTLNDLYAELKNLLTDIPELQDVEPTYRDFRVGDVRHSLADISKAKQLLNYQPSHTLRDGLQQTVEWYKRLFA